MMYISTVDWERLAASMAEASLSLKKLKPFYQKLRDEYERDYLSFECPNKLAPGCDCIRCVHAGNPKNQQSEICYVNEEADRIWKAVEGVAG